MGAVLLAQEVVGMEQVADNEVLVRDGEVLQVCCTLRCSDPEQAASCIVLRMCDSMES